MKRKVNPENCFKIPYTSRGEAMRSKAKKRLGLKTYRCQICGAWHLTKSREKPLPKGKMRWKK